MCGLRPRWGSLRKGENGEKHSRINFPVTALGMAITHKFWKIYKMDEWIVFVITRIILTTLYYRYYRESCELHRHSRYHELRNRTFCKKKLNLQIIDLFCSCWRDRDIYCILLLMLSLVLRCVNKSKHTHGTGQNPYNILWCLLLFS